MEQIIIALGNNQNHSVKLAKSSKEPINIGRGYQNDIVLNDPFVAEKQVTFVLDDEQWCVDVIQHINPVLLNGKQIRIKTAVNAGDQLTVGNSLLRILSKNSPIEKTREFLLSSWMLHGNRNKNIPLISLALVGFVFILYEYLIHSTTLKWTIPFQTAAGQIVFILFWALFWSSIARRFTHHHHFQTQIVITSLVTLAGLFIAPVTDLLQYNSNSQLIGQIGEYIFSFIELFILIKLSMFFWPNIKTSYSVALIASLSIHISSYYIIEYGEEQLEIAFPDRSIVLPPFAKLASNLTIDEFISNNKSLYSIETKE